MHNDLGMFIFPPSHHNTAPTNEKRAPIIHVEAATLINISWIMAGHLFPHIKDKWAGAELCLCDTTNIEALICGRSTAIQW